MIYSSWDIAQHILKLVILGRFLPFYLPKNPINQNFQKWKNLLEISSFYTCVPKTTSPLMILKIKILRKKNEVWFLRYGARQTDFFCHSGPFFWKSKFWKNEKNASRYYHFTNVYHKWQSHYVWFLRYGVQGTEFLSFWTVFWTFNPLIFWKIKILKKWRKKKHLEILSFYTGVP